MDIGLDLQTYSIVEPWTDLDNDVCHYLYHRGIKFTMHGSSDGTTAVIVYLTNISGHEALQIKLVFPGVSVTPSAVPKKVSTLEQV